MTPAEVLNAIRDIVAAAELAGWDNEAGYREILNRGREAYADLQTVMADTDEEADHAG